MQIDDLGHHCLRFRKTFTAACSHIFTYFFGENELERVRCYFLCIITARPACPVHLIAASRIPLHFGKAHQDGHHEA